MEPSKSQTEALSDVFAACKSYAMGFAELTEAIRNYVPDNSIETHDSLAFVGYHGIAINPFVKEKKMLVRQR